MSQERRAPQKQKHRGEGGSKKETINGFGHTDMVARAIVRMRRGITKKTGNNSLEIGSNTELRQTEQLLYKLDTFILPELEDATQASLPSTVRQIQTAPERCVGLTPQNSENPNDNPYASIVVSQSLDLTTSIAQLCDCTVIVVGLTGTGSKLATLLARRGLGRLILFDPFYVGPTEWRHNLEFTPSMANLSKARAVCGVVAELNADTQVEAICCDVRDVAVGSTLLAHCMKTGTAIVPATYQEQGQQGERQGVEAAAAAAAAAQQKYATDTTLEMHVLDVQTEKGTSRQVKTCLTHVNRLPFKKVDLTPLITPSSSPEDARYELKNLLPPHKRNNEIVVVCCDDDVYVRTIVGELAMESGLTALFTTDGGSTSLGTASSVVPGVTACLQCRRSHNNASIDLPLPPRPPHAPPSSYSPATQAIMASTVCQTTLKALLSNMHSNITSVMNTEFSSSNDRIEAISSEKPSRKCKSLHCRSQQNGHRKNLRKQQMRKVLKVSNMFAWTKKK